MTYTPFDSFIIKHQLELTVDDWNDISKKYELSVDMMRMFQNKINWRYIAEYQNLSVSFIREFIEYLLGPYMEVSVNISIWMKILLEIIKIKLIGI